MRHFVFASLLATVCAVDAASQIGTAPLDGPAYLHDPRWIEVKLVEGCGAVLDASGRLESRSGADLSAVAGLFSRADRARRAIEIPLDVLDRWHLEADARLPEGALRPGHLGLWFRLRVDDATEAAALRAALRASSFVEYADHEPVRVPCSPRVTESPAETAFDDIPPFTPSFESYQGYRGVAPVGMGFDAVRSVLGARGEDVTVFHVESDWVWDHEDLGLTPADFLGAMTPGTGNGSNHGTGVVGVLYARRNGYGMTGVVDATRLQLVPVDQHASLANATALAILMGQPGDVLTLIGGYNLQLTKPDDIVPYEYFRVNFDVILTASTQGMIVIESAGNGDNDLDDLRFQRRFDLSVRDSGAIFVGATDGAQTVRAPFSNYGSRIDTNGWGYEVATLGYGTLFSPNGDRRQNYTERYAGTSSASAILTGVAASLSSAARVQGGRTLSPLELRQLLRAHGTPIPAGQIGTRPDLPAMFDALGLREGLRVRSHEVALGTGLTLDLTGPSGGVAGIAFAVGRTWIDLGLGRALHLDPVSTANLGQVALSGGQGSWSVVVPNDPGLAGVDLYFQAVLFDPIAL
ncbi:MAG: S8 family serine peptidase, partial [Planctomycetota bacterium]|nr:S8 family serine peptidase [Planctomycetota bacterium]